jgi:23S rRNA (uracil1939-C5)-methyltransferase
MVEILEPSADRQRPPCMVADKCGGCQWQHLTPAAQGRAKQQQVVEALQRIGGFSDPPVDAILPNTQPLHYRNKVTYPLGRSATGQLQAGYYRRGSHRLVNLNQCPIQDLHFDALLPHIKQDLRARGWSVYDETSHRGALRHLSLRVSSDGQVLLTLVSRELSLPGLEEQAHQWLRQYPNIVGVCVNHNPQRGNAIFGLHTYCVAGQPYLEETWMGLQLRLGAETFFQVHRTQAEALVTVMLEELQLTGTEAIVDAYCGVGTLTLPLAQRSGKMWGIESNLASVERARENAALNGLTQVQFQAGTVETQLAQMPFSPDIVVLDPPRKGCEGRVLETLLTALPPRIVYMSCNPATLARDLKVLCQSGDYHLDRVQPADFFPQTAHVEAVAFLRHPAN